MTVNVTASDPDGDAILSLTADVSNLGGNAAFVSSADHTSGTLTWTPTANGNFSVTFRASNALTGTATSTIRVKSRLVATALPAGEDDVPAELALSPALPNPTRGGVAFELALPHASRVEWGVFDLQGREVLHESRMEAAGRITLQWQRSPRGAAHGVYFARVRVGSTTLVRRFLNLP